MRHTPSKRTTTPEEEGIELHPDAWERVERTVDAVIKGGRPVRRAVGKGKVAANRAPKPRGDAN
jgi:hypothetical protein